MRRERAAPARCSRAAAGAGRGGGAARRPGGRGSFFRAVAVAAASLALKMADGGNRGVGATATRAAGGRVPAQSQERAMVRLPRDATARFPPAPFGSSPCCAVPRCDSAARLSAPGAFWLPTA